MHKWNWRSRGASASLMLLTVYLVPPTSLSRAGEPSSSWHVLSSLSSLTPLLLLPCPSGYSCSMLWHVFVYNHVFKLRCFDWWIFLLCVTLWVVTCQIWLLTMTYLMDLDPLMMLSNMIYHSYIGDRKTQFLLRMDLPWLIIGPNHYI